MEIERSFTGGLHWLASDGLGRAADSPLVRLYPDDHGVRIEPSSLLARLITFNKLPRYVLPWNSIIRAERVKKGVRFFARDIDQSIIFVTSSDVSNEILIVLEEHDILVDRTMHQTHWWEQAEL